MIETSVEMKILLVKPWERVKMQQPTPPLLYTPNPCVFTIPIKKKKKMTCYANGYCGPLFLPLPTTLKIHCNECRPVREFHYLENKQVYLLYLNTTSL